MRRVNAIFFFFSPLDFGTLFESPIVEEKDYSVLSDNLCKI